MFSPSGASFSRFARLRPRVVVSANACWICFQTDASEGGSGRTKPLAMGSVVLAVPSVGRFLRAPSSLGVVPTCTNSASPGLATTMAAGPFEPKQSPTRVVSGYPPRLSVLPNTAIPRIPLVARSLLSCRHLNHSATYWIFRSVPPRGGKTKLVQVARSASAWRPSNVARRGSPARTSIFVILPFSILSSSAISRVTSAPSAKSAADISFAGLRLNVQPHIYKNGRGRALQIGSPFRTAEVENLPEVHGLAKPEPASAGVGKVVTSLSLTSDA